MLYFINEIVEDLLRKYIWTGCTSVSLRDEAMGHAVDLIRQIIRKQGLHTIYTGHEESSFNDLLQTAWVQIERTLYKFRARPHCRPCYNPDRPNDSVLYRPGDLEYGIITYEGLKKIGITKCQKCGVKISPIPEVEPRQDVYGGSLSVIYRGESKVFNMWSQVARTVILAYIKKEGRDRKNSASYRSHVASKINQDAPEDLVTLAKNVERPTADVLEQLRKEQPLSDVYRRLLTEARELCKYNENFLTVIDALEHLMYVDTEPAQGLIGKLVERSGLSRTTVTQFMRHIKLLSFEISDSTISRASSRNTDRRYYEGFADKQSDFEQDDMADD